MEDLFDEKLLEAIRLAEALQDGQSEEKESEGKKTEGKQDTESSGPVSRQEEQAADPAPQTGEEAVDLLIKEIVQEAQDEIAAEGIRTPAHFHVPVYDARYTDSLSYAKETVVNAA